MINDFAGSMAGGGAARRDLCERRATGRVGAWCDGLRLQSRARDLSTAPGREGGEAGLVMRE